MQKLTMQRFDLGTSMLQETAAEAIKNWKENRSPFYAAIIVSCWMQAKNKDGAVIDLEADLDAVIDDPGLAESAEVSTGRGVCESLGPYNKFSLTPLELAELRDLTNSAYNTALGLYALGRRASSLYLKQLRWLAQVLKSNEASDDRSH